MLAIPVTMALLIGFLLGLLTFKRSLRWCPACGPTLVCPQGHRRSADPAGVAGVAGGGR